jgi:curved DNA-binding protein CbpA
VKRLGDQTLYEILEVPTDAAPPAIEAAYDRARSLYGPGSLATYTLMTAEEAALLTSRIEEAKRTLLDPDARAHYDASLASPAAPARGENGAAAPSFADLPPVIPAVQVPGARTTPPAEPPEARPAELLREAARAAPPAPAPIPLDREIRQPRQAASAAPEPEIPMPEDSLWTGDALRRVREARGITVQQIAERTKVTRHHVENIEGERFSALPAPVYLRGILLAIARELRLDGLKVARAYLERAGAAAKPR